MLVTRNLPIHVNEFIVSTCNDYAFLYLINKTNSSRWLRRRRHLTFTSTARLGFSILSGRNRGINSPAIPCFPYSSSSTSTITAGPTRRSRAASATATVIASLVKQRGRQTFLSVHLPQGIYSYYQTNYLHTKDGKIIISWCRCATFIHGVVFHFRVFFFGMLRSICSGNNGSACMRKKE